jgi:hypothetical protein
METHIVLTTSEYIETYCEIATALLAGYYKIYDYQGSESSQADQDKFCECCDFAEEMMESAGITKEVTA